MIYEDKSPPSAVLIETLDAIDRGYTTRFNVVELIQSVLALREAANQLRATLDDEIALHETTKSYLLDNEEQGKMKKRKK